MQTNHESLKLQSLDKTLNTCHLAMRFSLNQTRSFTTHKYKESRHKDKEF